MTLLLIYRKNLAQRFRVKKEGKFWSDEPFFEFDAAHRTRKMVKYGQNLTFFDRNGSGLSFYHLSIQQMKAVLSELELLSRIVFEVFRLYGDKTATIKMKK